MPLARPALLLINITRNFFFAKPGGKVKGIVKVAFIWKFSCVVLSWPKQKGGKKYSAFVPERKLIYKHYNLILGCDPLALDGNSNKTFPFEVFLTKLIFTTMILK